MDHERYPYRIESRWRVAGAIDEVYAQCARALTRAALWTGGDASRGLPSVGEMLREMTDGGFDGAAYDRDWPERAAGTLW